MKRLFFRALIAFACLASVGLAQAGFTINSFIAFPAAGGGPPAFNYRATYSDTANAGSRSYVAADIGVDDALRFTIVTSESTGGSGDTAVTICGIGATQIVVSANTGRWSSIWGAATNGQGTTCTIGVTHGGTPTANSISVYAGYPASVTAVDTATTNAASADPTASDLAKTISGFTICSVETNNTASTIAVAQNGAETVTENSDLDVEAGLSSGSYSHINTATTTTDDYTATISGTNGRSISCASWGP